MAQSPTQLTSPKNFGIEGPWDIGQPVHENVTLAALYQQRDLLDLSGCNFNALWEDPLLNEYLRGVFWNDDPDVLMFDKDTDSDADFSSGSAWGAQFYTAEYATSNDLTNFTGRSHFWDMQFLHGMACDWGETPATTQGRMMMWAELMYKVAIGQPVTGVASAALTTPEAVAATLLSAVKIPETPPKAPSLGFSYYFSSATDPTNAVSIKTMLTEGDTFTGLDIAKRAIRTVMHMIQDSYARGHVRRDLKNPEDLLTQTATSMTFMPGTWGMWGSIVTFHTYRGQDSAEHKAFDETDATLNPTDLSSFNTLVGGRDAIERCQNLLEFFANRVRWENEVDKFFEEIFALDPAATNADINVNRVPIPGVHSTGDGTIGVADPHWKLQQTATTSAPAYIVTANHAWINANATAKWISIATNTQGASNTDYVYRTTIDLTGYRLTTVLIMGLVSGDDQCTEIKVNGKSVYAPFGIIDVAVNQGGGYVSMPIPGPNYTVYGGFVIDAPYLFKREVNEIEFCVHNAKGPTGVEVIFTNVAAVPI